MIIRQNGLWVKIIIGDKEGNYIMIRASTYQEKYNNL